MDKLATVGIAMLCAAVLWAVLVLLFLLEV